MRQRNAHLGFALMIVLLAASPVWALIAGFNADIHMDMDGVIANDFHIEGRIKSGPWMGNWSQPPVLLVHIDGMFPIFIPSIVPDPGVPGENTYKFTADWSGHDYKYCEVLHLGLFFDVECHNLVIDLVGWWTVDGKPIGGMNGGAVLIPGFDVQDQQLPQLLQIRNDSHYVDDGGIWPGIDGRIAQMEVAVLSREEMEGQFGPVEEMFAELRLGGRQEELPWFPIQTAGEAFPPGGFFDVTFGVGTGLPTIPPGGFLVTRVSVEFLNNNGEPDFRWTWHLHEAHQELDFGDAPEFLDPLTGAVIGYPTRLLPLDGARHIIRGPWLGGPNDRPDPEADGQPHPQALGDNNNGSNDENGVTIPPVLVIGNTYTIDFMINSDDGGGGTVSGWIDYNGDYMWDSTEQVVAVSAGNGPLPVNITVPSTAVTGTTFARFRITRDTVAVGSPTGLARDGEVEDYLVEIEEQPPQDLDFGDAPDGAAALGYPTLLPNGARHAIVPSAPWLGGPDDMPDPEANGQPHPQAMGDDIAGNDDENGVIMPPMLIHGVPVDITILVSGGSVGSGPDGYLNGWIDFNDNKTWEAGEQIISGLKSAGTITVPVTAPAGSVVGPTFARFRINSRGDIGPDGAAVDGEVEDYIIYIRRGPIEVDVFEDASMDLTLMMPDGTSEAVSLTGPMEMHVFFEGLYEGDARDDDNDGNDDVETELVALSLSGQSSIGLVQMRRNPNLPSPGEMEEMVNNTPGRLDVKPFENGGQINSFFDGFFDITVETPLGPIALTNQQPLRLAGVFTEKPTAECEDFRSTNSVQLFDENGQLTPMSIAAAVLKPKPCLLDWGDAPEIAGTPMLYPTLAPDGARHRINPNVFLGNTTITDTTILTIDAENNGQPTMAADGDDVLDLNDDEDGIRFLTWPLRPGRPAKIEVRASIDGYLSAWIDFGADGSWVEADDYIAFDGAAAAGPLAIPAGTTVHVFQVPTSAKPNTKTYSRFRFSTDPITTFEGYARNGEVEDYLVKIRSHPGIKWIQRPDETKLGIDIRVDSNDGIQRMLADDFECTSYGYITDVHLWGSWKNDDRGHITNIHLSIHSDDPASTEPGDTFSKPDKLLWEDDFSPGQFKEKLHIKVKEGEFWWDPYRNVWLAPGDHEIWRIDINIHPKAAFLQEGSPEEPIVYWLDVAVKTDGGEFGWKTRRWPKHYNDDAVRSLLDVDGNHIGWQDLHYPDGHPLNEANPDDPPSIDMAFVVTTDNAVTGSGDLDGNHVVDLADFAIYVEEYKPGVLLFPN